MPTTITLYSIGVWFCVGLFTGFGWFLASVLIARVFARI